MTLLEVQGNLLKLRLGKRNIYIKQIENNFQNKNLRFRGTRLVLLGFNELTNLLEHH